MSLMKYKTTLIIS